MSKIEEPLYIIGIDPVKKQTAVQWYRNTFFKALQEGLITSENEIFEQAKAMERDQIIDAYTECWMMDGGNGNHKLKEANEYFNETYGGDK
jgi:hypothetical protein